MELERNGGMLLAPEREQGTGEPAPVHPKVMNAGVAGRAEGDQPGWGVNTGAAVMNGALVAGAAGAAAVAVSF